MVEHVLERLQLSSGRVSFFEILFVHVSSVLGWVQNFGPVQNSNEDLYMAASLEVVNNYGKISLNHSRQFLQSKI